MKLILNVFWLPFLLFLSTGFTSFSPAPKWVTYTSEVCKAKMAFPAPFEEDVEEKDYGNTHKVSATVDGQTFFFATTIHNNPLTDRYQLAEVSLESFLESVQGQLIESHDYFYKKHKGISAKIKLDERTIDYRIILIGQHQYQLIAIFENEYNEKASQKFFKSFKRLK